MGIKGVNDDSRMGGNHAMVPVTRPDWQGKATVVAAISDSDPADLWLAITPDDDAVFDPPPTAVFVGTGGNISLADSDGDVAVFKNIPNASILPLQPSKIRQTGTTAADIIAIFRSDP